jgi:hypothetical protein
MNKSGCSGSKWAACCLGVGLVLGLALMAEVAEAKPVQFAQPFLIDFDRHDVQVIAFLNHPKYDAVEAFVTKRPGQIPFIRAILTRLDGFQIEVINDQAVAAERAALLTGRQVAFGEISYQESVLSNFAPRVVVSFTSPDNETIYMDLSALFPASPTQGGLVDPGNHAQGSSLPVMWRDAGTIGGFASVVLINGVQTPIDPGPIPGSLSAFYTAGFHIGVIRAGALEMSLVSAPNHVGLGASWTYMDQISREHRYEITSVNGDLVGIRKTTLDEEIILARAREQRKDILDILNVRVTGVPASAGSTPPAPTGFDIDLSVPGTFSISIDQHANLMSGNVSTVFDDFTASWMLSPTQPSWAVPRVVHADVAFDKAIGLSIFNTIGGP